MSRRRSARRPRRVPIHFWRQGDAQPVSGYTTNISLTGMFIGTNSPLPQGTRLRIEILGERGFVVEGIVAHARKIRGELARLTQSGMGVRFLSIDELMRDLIPSASEILRGEAGPAQGNPSTIFPAAPIAADTSPEPSAAGEPPAAFEPVPTPPPPAPPPPSFAPAAPRLPAAGAFAVRFASPRHFLDVFERDIKNGGLFVSTLYPARLHEVITIELHPPRQDAAPILVRARVVQRFEPNSTSPLAGMGVELLDPQAVAERLRPVVDEIARL